MDYKARIEQIARRDGITITYPVTDILESYSQVPNRTLALAPWGADEKRQHVQYWIALHEMGHVATTDPRHDPMFLALFGGEDEIVETEAKAWDWAIRENGGQVDEVGKTVIAAAMGTYTKDFGTGGDDTRQLAQRVTDAGAFSGVRREDIPRLLA